MVNYIYKYKNVKTVEEYFQAVKDNYWNIVFPNEIKDEIAAELEKRKDEDIEYLARYLKDGCGITKDNIPLYNYLIAHNHPYGYNSLGILAWQLGDDEKEKEYYRLGAKLNYAACMTNLANKYIAEKDYQRAIYFVKMACKLDNPVAYLLLARMYRCGYGLHYSFYHISLYYEKAIKLGSKKAKKEYKEFLRNG